MWTRKLLKENAKIAFKRNYWLCVVVSLIATLLGASTSGSSLDFESDESTTNTGYYEEYYDEYYDDDLDIYYEEDYTEYDQNIASDILAFIASPIFIAVFVVVLVIAIGFTVLVSNVVKVGHRRFYLENREYKSQISRLFYSFGEGRYGRTVWTMFCMDLYIFGWTLLFIIPGIIKSFSYMMVPYILADNPEIENSRAFEISKEMMNGHKWDAFELGWSFFGWQLLTTVTFGLVGIFWTGPYMDATYAEFYTALKAEAFQRGITNSVELPGVSKPAFTEEFAQ